MATRRKETIDPVEWVGLGSSEARARALFEATESRFCDACNGAASINTLCNDCFRISEFISDTAAKLLGRLSVVAPEFDFDSTRSEAAYHYGFCCWNHTPHDYRKRIKNLFRDARREEKSDMRLREITTKIEEMGWVKQGVNGNGHLTFVAPNGTKLGIPQSGNYNGRRADNYIAEFRRKLEEDARLVEPEVLDEPESPWLQWQSVHTLEKATGATSRQISRSAILGQPIAGFYFVKRRIPKEERRKMGLAPTTRYLWRGYAESEGEPLHCRYWRLAVEKREAKQPKTETTSPDSHHGPAYADGSPVLYPLSDAEYPQRVSAAVNGQSRDAADTIQQHSPYRADAVPTNGVTNGATNESKEASASSALRAAEELLEEVSARNTALMDENSDLRSEIKQLRGLVESQQRTIDSLGAGVDAGLGKKGVAIPVSMLRRIVTHRSEASGKLVGTLDELTTHLLLAFVPES